MRNSLIFSLTLSTGGTGDLGEYSVTVEGSRHLQGNPELWAALPWQCPALWAPHRQHQRLLLHRQLTPPSQHSCNHFSPGELKYFPGNKTNGRKETPKQLKFIVAALPHSTSTTAEGNPLWKRYLLECHKRTHKHSLYKNSDQECE